MKRPDSISHVRDRDRGRVYGGCALDHHGPCMRRLDRCTHAHNINDQTVKFSIRVKLNSSELELDLESEILDVQVTWVVKHSAQHPPWPSSAGP